MIQEPNWIFTGASTFHLTSGKTPIQFFPLERPIYLSFIGSHFLNALELSEKVKQIRPEDQEGLPDSKRVVLNFSDDSGTFIVGSYHSSAFKDDFPARQFQGSHRGLAHAGPVKRNNTSHLSPNDIIQRWVYKLSASVSSPRLESCRCFCQQLVPKSNTKRRVWPCCNAVLIWLFLQGMFSNTLLGMDEGDILAMRRQGHLIYHSYFQTRDKLLDTIAATLSQRLGLEPQEYSVCLLKMLSVGYFCNFILLAGTENNQCLHKATRPSLTK